MTRLLASVRDETEAACALAGGADIVDFKNVGEGALGALGLEVIAKGLRCIGRRAATSATAGDWPLDIQLLINAVRRVGATGVDYVKIGLLPGRGLDGCIDSLAQTTVELRLVAVFFADRGVPPAALPRLKQAGFAGAMIDTFDKQRGGLRQLLKADQIETFVASAHRLGLMTGLAGSLRVEDIAALTELDPDLLGFRSALCAGAERTTSLSLARVRSVRAALDQARLDRGEIDVQPGNRTPA